MYRLCYVKNYHSLANESLTVDWELPYQWFVASLPSGEGIDTRLDNREETEE